MEGKYQEGENEIKMGCRYSSPLHLLKPTMDCLIFDKDVTKHVLQQSVSFILFKGTFLGF